MGFSIAPMGTVLLALTLTLGASRPISAAVVEFKSATFETSELDAWSDKTITLTCTPPPPTGPSIRVEVRVIPETATWESDFGIGGVDPVGRTFVAYFDSSAREIHIPFIVRDDGLPETDETVRFEIVSVGGNGNSIGAQSTATLTIRNAGPHLTLFAQLAWGEGGPGEFFVGRQGDTNVSVSVEYATTTHGTAIPGADFIPAAGRLEFIPGEQYKYIPVALPDNGAVHAPRSKTVVLQLSNPTGATLDPTPVVGYIEDDEIPATVDLSFNPDLGWGLWPGLTAVAIEKDGGILVAGRALFLNDRQVCLLRLRADGTADPRFRPMDLGTIRQIMPAHDGRIWIVSATEDGDPPIYEERDRLVGFPAVLTRLLADGAMDASFGTFGRVDLPAHTGVLLQRDGKIVRFGNRLSGLDSSAIRRLNLDGSEDSAFAANTSASPRLVVSQAIEHRDSKLLVAGRQPDGISTIVRLNPDGTRDEGFPNWLAREMGPLLVLSDGKILVHVNDGEGELAGRRIVRLLPDGELDRNFPDWGSEWFVPWADPYFFAEVNGRVYFTRSGAELLRTRLDGLPDPGFAVRLTHAKHGVGSGGSTRAAAGGGSVLCWTASESLVNGLERPLARIVLDDEPPPAFAFDREPAFAVRDSSLFTHYPYRHPWVALETNGAARMVVRRLGDVSAPARVRFATEDRTARAGEHYFRTEGTFVFAPLEREKEITVPLIEDTAFRGAPEFLLSLSDPSLPAQEEGPITVRIYDSEPGLIWGRVLTRKDGVLLFEYDVTSQVLVRLFGVPFFYRIYDVPIEISVDLEHWSLVPPEQKGGRYPWNTGMGRDYDSPPHVLIPPGSDRRFFRVRIGD